MNTINTINTERTIDAYNKNAVKYAEKFDNYQIYQNKISDFQHKHITKGAHILDVGCGPGNNIKTILQHDNTCSFEGIDLSEKFIEIARQRFPQFKFTQQNIIDLALQSTYTTVIASFCIVHLSNEETIDFIKNLSHIVTNNGCLYLSYMNGTTSGFESTSFSKEEIYFNYYQDQFITDLLSDNGLNISEISKEEYLETDGSKTIDTFIYARNIKP
jgi:2-polyprenyl-3-methyl-5-hydroxy-6-metoxy-1,4-benzoquinol methylase